jgi:hypothetical protein
MKTLAEPTTTISVRKADMKKFFELELALAAKRKKAINHNDLFHEILVHYIESNKQEV